MVGAGVFGVGVFSCPVVVVFVVWWLGPFFLVDDDVPRKCFFLVSAILWRPLGYQVKVCRCFFTGDLYFFMVLTSTCLSVRLGCSGPSVGAYVMGTMPWLIRTV